MANKLLGLIAAVFVAYALWMLPWWITAGGAVISLFAWGISAILGALS